MTRADLPRALRDALPPALVADPDYDRLVAETITVFRGLAPQFDALLESDPAIKVIEANEFAIFVFLLRMNKTFPQAFAALATEANLDYHASKYGLEREQGETDSELYQRIVRFNTNKSVIGTLQNWVNYIASRDLSVMGGQKLLDKIIVFTQDVQRFPNRVNISITTSEATYWSTATEQPAAGYQLYGDTVQGTIPAQRQGEMVPQWIQGVRDYLAGLGPAGTASAPYLQRLEDEVGDWQSGPRPGALADDCGRCRIPVGIVPVIKGLVIISQTVHVSITTTQSVLSVRLSADRIRSEWNDEHVGQPLTQTWLRQAFLVIGNIIQFHVPTECIGVLYDNYVRIDRMVIRQNNQIIYDTEVPS